MTQKPLVVISGLPGSGKTTPGRRLAPLLQLPLIDKDEILDRLFETKGIGDAAWRRALSRESDDRLRDEAVRSDGAIVVSFWRLPGMQADSGTPTDWLRTASDHLVHVHCACAADVLADLEALVRLAPLDIGPRIDVETSSEPDLNDVVRAIRAALDE